MSTRAYTSLSFQQFLTKNIMTLMLHPLCSPSLIPEQLFFVSLMKKVLKGKHFANVEEVKQKMIDALKAIKIKEFSPGWCGSVD